MPSQDQPKPKPVDIKLDAAQGISEGHLGLTAGGSATIPLQPSHGTSHASLGLASGSTIRAASGAVVGASQPQPETVGEDLGVLGWVVGGVAFGFEVGDSIGHLPVGVAGAALGGAAACAVVRWIPAREQAFKFIRWLDEESDRH